MKFELLTAKESAACEKAAALWRSVCAGRGIELSVLAADSDEGRRRLRDLGLEVLPVLLIDGKPAAVGVPSRREALDMVSSRDDGLR